ncbi:MAG: very short patch repair endonuclease [Fidelibacterota bacterium]
MDVFSKDKRSEIMSNISDSNTKPEIIVRSILHKMGYRFRLHKKNLPGKPDIVLPKHRKIIFVHGCFWHSHENCRRSKRPSTNTKFWSKKLDSNKKRDKKILKQLKDIGWKVLIVWTCEINKIENLKNKLKMFLNEEV